MWSRCGDTCILEATPPVQIFHVSDILTSVYLIKKQRTFCMFLSSYSNTNGSFGEQEVLWEHEVQTSVSTACPSSSKLSQVFL